MQKKTTLEVIAPTVEDAISNGLEELGLTAADVSVEVLDVGSKGFLGLGKRQVRVRLTVNELPKPIQTEPAKKKPAPKTDLPKTEEPAKPQQAAAQKKVGIPAEKGDDLLSISKNVIGELINLMHLEADISAHYDESSPGRNAVYVEINGKNIDVLIGRRGETINAFQRIAALILNKKMGHWVRLTIDVGGHRSRRIKQLHHMAQRIAEQVAKTGHRQSLEPMPPNERRIIHMQLQNHPQVKTKSVGEDTQRKVVIEPK